MNSDPILRKNLWILRVRIRQTACEIYVYIWQVISGRMGAGWPGAPVRCSAPSGQPRLQLLEDLSLNNIYYVLKGQCHNIFTPSPLSIYFAKLTHLGPWLICMLKYFRIIGDICKCKISAGHWHRQVRLRGFNDTANIFGNANISPRNRSLVWKKSAFEKGAHSDWLKHMKLRGRGEISSHCPFKRWICVPVIKNKEKFVCTRCIRNPASYNNWNKQWFKNMNIIRNGTKMQRPKHRKCTN